jgi:glycosyltransferase involved in cell wall biosynthesis
MNSKPIVSVVMITYGHEKYIRQAIEGVLMQKCDFEIELIIANDCSPDNTDIIIQDILKNHQNSSWIKHFQHNNNLGMMPNFQFALENATSKYIALCEGDDYWTDENKLQKQVDFLENNNEYVLTFHKVKILNLNGLITDDFLTKIPDNYESIENLAQFGNYIHTPSVVFRNILKEYPIEFQLTPIGDYFLYLMLAQHGKIKYLHDQMCVYRYGVGVFSGKNNTHLAKTNLLLFNSLVSYFQDIKIKNIFIERQKKAIDALENAINNSYKKSFVSNNWFFLIIKFLSDNFKNPKKIFEKIYQKLTK